MKTYTKVLAAIVAVVGIVGPLVTPLLEAWVTAHPHVALTVAAITTILGLFHNPTVTPPKAS